ncbi:MAG TPA: sigma factor-like helix-turn-helix DNA-binding protein, partial [Candidatus Avamphibacillus sp.]|nr:sigma factor-like helix-turn-helix DNA-binding protein [Candidatus Avamphibacillus sp.]
KKAREQQNDELFIQAGKQELDNGNRSRKNNLPIPDFSEITVKDADIWKQVQETLTENQWKWVYCYIISDMPMKDIAEREGVSVDAVKSWSRQARKKLRNDGLKEKLQGLLEV